MNDPKLMTGPQDLWHLAGFEWSNGKYDKPIFVRAAFRRGEPADGFTQLRDRVADVLDDFHPMDFKPVRVLYRVFRGFDEVLFGDRRERETSWITGVALTCIVFSLAVLIVTR